jgi:hypothetical protein
VLGRKSGPSLPLRDLLFKILRRPRVPPPGKNEPRLRPPQLRILIHPKDYPLKAKNPLNLNGRMSIRPFLPLCYLLFKPSLPIRVPPGGKNEPRLRPPGFEFSSIQTTTLQRSKNPLNLHSRLTPHPPFLPLCYLLFKPLPPHPSKSVVKKSPPLRTRSQCPLPHLIPLRVVKTNPVPHPPRFEFSSPSTHV